MSQVSVYSVRFVAEHESSGLVSYTVPSDYVAILRDVDVTNTGGVSGAFVVYGPGGINFWEWAPVYSATAPSASWRGRQVYNPGDVMAFQGVTSVYDYMASGYLLLA